MATLKDKDSNNLIFVKGHLLLKKKSNKIKFKTVKV
jgi:hypothetical protein